MGIIRVTTIPDTQVVAPTRTPGEARPRGEEVPAPGMGPMEAPVRGTDETSGDSLCDSGRGAGFILIPFLRDNWTIWRRGYGVRQGGRRKSDGYLKITRTMTTKLRAVRTSKKV